MPLSRHASVLPLGSHAADSITLWALLTGRSVSLIFVFHMSSSQLTTGTINVPSHFPANGSVHSVFLQSFTESGNGPLFRLNKVSLLYRIDRNQIYMRMKWRCQSDQSCSVLFGIIDTTYQTVFKSDASSGLLKIIGTRLHQFINTVLIRNRH